LAAHLHDQEASFGKDAVFTYRSRRFGNCGPATGHYQARALFLSLCGLIWFATGLGWLLIKNDDEFAPWMVFGAVLMIISFLVWLGARLHQGRTRRLPHKYRNAGIVISPAGLFLRQGDLEGFLQWDELRKVWFHANLKSFTVSSADSNFLGVDLFVDGAVIRLADIYDRPLAFIHSTIGAFWKPPRPAPANVRSP